MPHATVRKVMDRLCQGATGPPIGSSPDWPRPHPEPKLLRGPYRVGHGLPAPG